MLKKLFNILTEFLKKFFIMIAILSFILIVIDLFKYNVSTLLDFESGNAISISFISIPKVLIILFLLIFGILIVLVCINMVFRDYFKNSRK